MTLPTPPHTRNNKENRRAVVRARVAWSQVNEYHPLVSPTRPKNLAASASKDLPVRSILKQTSYSLFPLLLPENERQITPEPGDPLSDLHYLDHPMNKILSKCSTLADLIEAYSVLTARLRVAVQETTDSSCSWPLFQPLRMHRVALVDAVVRDLGRALVDPMEGCDRSDCSTPEPRSSLPSPEKSPRKKRCGMNEEQVKYARDLATVSHAVIKLLGLAFTLPAVYGLFDDQELGCMVTQVLAIPLAPELPTPNGRKTCALAIWLLQTQRLPADILAPAKDRITYALRRAVEGELGKEGKKGAVSDGLKAIHDLAIHEPSVFLPAFIELLPSILENLLAPRLALRAQACHALGGLALGASQIPLSYTHTRLSETVAAALEIVPAPSSSPRTPTKSDSMLVKTLRTTLGAHDPSCAAQGPVWALCTLAALVVLLGPALVTSAKLTNALKGLLALSVRHKKSSVRALACAVWRPLAWAYFRPPLPRKREQEEDGGDEDGGGRGQEWEEDEDERTTKAAAWTQAEGARRDDFWKVVATMVDMGAGVGSVGALLAHKTDDARSVSRGIALLEAMVQRGGNMCHDAVQTLCRLVSAPRGALGSPSIQCEQEEEDEEEEGGDWDWTKLVPASLFSADPGLLTVEFGSLSEQVRPLLKQTPSVADVRALSAAELWMPGVMDGLIKVWRTALTQVCLSSDAELPPELVQSWNGLLKAALRGLRRSTDDDDQDDDSVQKLAELAVSLMQDILGDPKVQLVPAGDTPSTAPGAGSDVDLAPHTRSNAAMKLAVVRALWTHAHAVLPAQALGESASDALLTWLMEKEAELVWETDTPHDARTQWAMLCAEVLVRSAASSASSLFRVFWGARGASRRWAWSWPADVRALVWRTFAERWRALAKGWEEAPVLLSVPFADKDGWEMSTEDLDAWDATLQSCLGRVLDEGADTTRVLDHVAGTIASTHIPTGASATRAADILLGHLEAPHEAPALLGFVNDTLVSTYPPEPRNKVASMWLMRTVKKVVGTCPGRMLREVVAALQEGLSVWVADQYRVFTAEEYAFDIVPVYQTTMLCLQSLGACTDNLKALSPLFEAGFTGREDKPQDMVESFQDYWDMTYAEVPVPEGGWPSPVVTCLRACGRLVIPKPTPLPEEAVAENTPVPTLESAFSWSSSSTLAAEEDNASETTEMSQDSNPFATPTKVAEPPSTPRAALLTSSPQRPCKTSAIRRDHIFSPLAPTQLDFATSPAAAPSTPSRLPRSPALRSPKKVSDASEDKENTPPKPPALPSLMERIAMAASPGTPKLDKRPAGNVLTDSRPSKKRRGCAAEKLDNDDGDQDQDDSEAEREEVRQSLLRPVTPSPAWHPNSIAALAALTMTSSRVPPPAPPSSRSPSPTPQPAQRKRRRTGVFMEAVEVPQLQALRRPRRRTSLHIAKYAASSVSSEGPLPLAPLSTPLSSSGLVVRRSLRHSKSLIIGAEIPGRSVTVTPAQRKRQKKGAVESYVVAAAGSSSPISASLKRARVLVGSDDSMAAEIIDNYAGGAALPPSESSDGDPHQDGQLTPQHIFSPVLPRHLLSSSRFFAVDGKP